MARGQKNRGGAAKKIKDLPTPKPASRSVKGGTPPTASPAETVKSVQRLLKGGGLI